MFKKTLSIFLCGVMLLALLAGSGAAKASEDVTDAANVLPDGVYSAKFDTDSGMFHVNEAKNGRGVLTVKDGEMTIHVSLVSKKITKLYPGLAEAAQAEGAAVLEPTVDTVTYFDGFSEEVFGFDIPVPALDTEFDCALLGSKGTWYDHKVSVSDVVPMELEVEVTLAGGSGKAKVASPAKLTMGDDGIYHAIIVWSSPNYEYMLIGDTQYDPIQTEGNSTFEIPVELDVDMEIQAMNVAMSTPHLISYTLHFYSESNS